MKHRSQIMISLNLSVINKKNQDQRKMSDCR